MGILNQNKSRLENDISNITTRKNPDLTTSVIYLAAANVLQYSTMAENIREKEDTKRKQQIRQPPKRFLFKKSNLKLFRNANTTWIRPCIPQNKL